MEMIFKMLRTYSAGFIIKQYCIVEHAGIGIETGLGGLIEDQKGLVGVQVP